MKNFKLDGNTYEVIIHTGKKHKYEYIRYKTGYRKQWERITKQEFELKQKIKSDGQKI